MVDSWQEFPNLSSLVLNHWAWGRLHATEAHRFILAGHQDGIRNDEVSSIAQLGAWGLRPGNLHRELTNRYLKSNTLPKPEVFRVPHVVPKTLEVAELDASAILPHDFSDLFEHHTGEFEEIFGIKDMPAFWRGASRRCRGQPICMYVSITPMDLHCSVVALVWFYTILTLRTF